jgi:nucleotide-binding universal stress UspA family protein
MLGSTAVICTDKTGTLTGDHRAARNVVVLVATSAVIVWGTDELRRWIVRRRDERREEKVTTAFEEAALRGADLVAVHSWLEFVSDTEYATARQLLVGWDAAETREREILAERLAGWPDGRMAGWPEKYPDVTVRRVVAGGKPAALLLKEAGDAQLLVVGSRGRDGFAGMPLGSTSQALIHHAPCPLLVIRPAAAA